ncbi:hypothetical protein MJG53_001590 [Ovis ammon polii x Ovis aries]|uniref:Uncharacterized protein n=1 Tax=Ovis ammon polii x Ovis aries TaxID=2918886 RepID=A0ACB9VM63_9CETA|nr:hypothetical protein MJG53_001590 [Ovis ammon polii x Ovis aries]
MDIMARCGHHSNESEPTASVITASPSSVSILYYDMFNFIFTFFLLQDYKVSYRKDCNFLISPVCALELAFSLKEESAKDMKHRLGFLLQKSDSCEHNSSHSKKDKVVICQRVSHEEVKKWAESLENLISHECGLAAFKAFLKSEYSEENIDFWISCEEYKKIKSPSKLSPKAKKIYNEFISVQATKEVNLDSCTREETSRNMLEPTITCFDEAQKKIFNLMEKDSYRRFLKSRFYLDLVNLSSYPKLFFRAQNILDIHIHKLIIEVKGAVPFLVSATSGTTVPGAFDPLEAIADVCHHHGLWLHVDAAWGGSVLLSQTHRHLLAGIQRADSVAWNPHKLLSTSLQCSALLLRDTSNLLKRCHGSQASYLFQQDKFYHVALDRGDKVMQCGRRVDCLKLWLMRKAQGGQGLQRLVDQAFALAQYLVEELKKREGFELVMKPEFVNVCFWFVPPSLQGKKESPDYSERLSKVAPILKERMVRKGSMMIGYQPHGTRSNFFRMVVANPALTRADMDFLLNQLERLGQDF